MSKSTSTEKHTKEAMQREAGRHKSTYLHTQKHRKSHTTATCDNGEVDLESTHHNFKQENSNYPHSQKKKGKKLQVPEKMETKNQKKCKPQVHKCLRP